MQEAELDIIKGGFDEIPDLEVVYDKNTYIGGDIQFNYSRRRYETALLEGSGENMDKKLNDLYNIKELKTIKDLQKMLIKNTTIYELLLNQIILLQSKMQYLECKKIENINNVLDGDKKKIPKLKKLPKFTENMLYDVNKLNDILDDTLNYINDSSSQKSKESADVIELLVDEKLEIPENSNEALKYLMKKEEKVCKYLVKLEKVYIQILDKISEQMKLLEQK